MFSFVVEVRFWTLNEDICINDTDFGAFRYYEKKEEIKTATLAGKKIYAESRGYTWHLSNKRPFKLRHYLRELEGIIKLQRIVKIKWLDDNSVLLCLNSGLLIVLGINLYTGDVTNITFDRFLKDKLVSDHITDSIVTATFALCCYTNAQLTLLHFVKPVLKKSYNKLAHLDPKITSIDLPGPTGRKLHKKLMKNKTNDIIGVWWKYGQDEIFPWSPNIKDIDRANIYIYTITSCKLELLCYYRTEYNPLCLTFSAVESNILYSVEQKISRTGDISAESNTYEIVKYSRLQKTSSVSVPVQSTICCAEYSPDNSNLLLGCIDGSLVLYNHTRSLTHLIKAAFVPATAKWHPDGNIAVIASDQGQLQCFDFALGCIKMQLISEDVTPSSVIELSSYFRGPLALIRVLGMATIAPEILVMQYLNVNQVDRAINLLLALDWDTRPVECFSMLKLMAKHILSLSPLTLSEKQAPLQIALSSFYSPVQPISRSVEAEYCKPVRDIARRFFHHLLRYNLFEAAFKIASDLNEHDLFMDIYYGAKTGENCIIATMAWKRAEQICNADLSYTSSESSDCSCSGSTSQEDSTSETDNNCNSPLDSYNTLPLTKLPSQPYSSYASVTHLPPSYSAVFNNSLSYGNHSKLTNGALPNQSAPSGFLSKQKVKFSDTITHISNNSDLFKHAAAKVESPQSNSSVTNQCYNTGTETNANSIDDVQNKRLVNNLGANSTVFTTSESKSIKVVHFGIV